jgi:hypothetical protein
VRAVYERITYAVFAVTVIEINVDCILTNLFPFLKTFFKCGIATIEYFLFGFLKLFLRNRFIENMVGLLPEIPAEKAIIAPIAIDAKVGIARIAASPEM